MGPFLWQLRVLHNEQQCPVLPKISTEMFKTHKILSLVIAHTEKISNQ